MLNIEEALLETIRAFDCHPREINNGLCMRFAQMVVATLPGAEAKWGCDIDPVLDALPMCHCFVVYQGKIYDAECLDGVDSPRELPIYQRLLREIQEG